MLRLNHSRALVRCARALVRARRAASPGLGPSDLPAWETWRVRGGTFQVARRMAAELDGQVRLGERVERIERTPAGATVGLGRETLSADACVRPFPPRCCTAWSLSASTPIAAQPSRVCASRVPRSSSPCTSDRSGSRRSRVGSRTRTDARLDLGAASGRALVSRAARAPRLCAVAASGASAGSRARRAGGDVRRGGALAARPAFRAVGRASVHAGLHRLALAG